MEEQKKRAILDVECISCKHFFTCAGKEHKGQLCIRYEERGETKWPKSNG
jgi:hypothetical protein